MKSKPELGKEYIQPGEEEDIRKMIGIMRKSMVKEYSGKTILRRFHPKSHGLVKAEFKVHDDIPEELKVGLFKQAGTYEAFIRFSNCPQKVKEDKAKAARGMGIKVLNPPGPTLLEDPIGKPTQDFLMVTSTILATGNIRRYRKAMNALFGGFLPMLWTILNPVTWRELYLNLRNRIDCPNVLEFDYHSVAPYLYGDGKAVKFVAKSLKAAKSTMPKDPDDNFLRHRLEKDLKEGDYWFDFFVQHQTDPKKEPVEDNSRAWKSPMTKVASVRVLQQDFSTPDMLKEDENITFNPWHALAVHRPLGSINRCRKAVYDELSKFRRKENGVG